VIVDRRLGVALFLLLAGCDQTIRLLDSIPPDTDAIIPAGGGPAAGNSSNGGSAGSTSAGQSGAAGQSSTGGIDQSGAGQGGGDSGGQSASQGGVAGQSGGAGQSAQGGAAGQSGVDGQGGNAGVAGQSGSTGGAGGASGGQGGTASAGSSGGSQQLCAPPCRAVFESCDDGVCDCAAGLTRCGSSCVDLLGDSAFCGACDQRCDADEACSSGVCDCRSELMRCGAHCVDPASDANHCGECGLGCAEHESCVVGVCVEATCPTGLAACQASDPDGMGNPMPPGNGNGKKRGLSCIDLDRDPAHCGACGKECKTNEVCCGGDCTRIAPALPCTKCPCSEACAVLFGEEASCRTIKGDPYCVARDYCGDPAAL
jgi:hypothetical protein